MKILLVEDDVRLSATLVNLLEANRYGVVLAETGQIGLDLATTVEYDLILIDSQVPDIDGITLCRRLRAKGDRPPILLLTDNDAEAEVIAGLDAGADDYIAKPCVPDVLLARIRTWLRRSGALMPSPPSQKSATVLHWGALSLDPDSGRVSVGQTTIGLTATEYNLLDLFLRHPDRIFSRSVILDRLWGLADAPSDRAIVTHIKDVRKKLKAGGLGEEIIETIYGMGYRLNPPPPAAPVAPIGFEPEGTQPTPAPKQKSTVDQVLKRFQGVFKEQVAVLEQTKTGLLAGGVPADVQQTARQYAHKLAGSLASFGYPDGSKLARSIEHLLMDPQPFPPQAVTRFSELVMALEQALTQAPVTSPALPIPSPRTYRVLMIDDDTALTERLKAESEAWGVRLKIASSLEEARSRLMVNQPDVLLLDLSFPGAEDDGLSLLQEITERSPNLPVIVLTGRDSLADRLAVSRLGARQFLHKPVSPEQIFRAIARTLPPAQTTEARVLIVDDDPAMLTQLSGLLMPWGLEVATLNQPQQFWKVLVATTPHLVLLDLEMPEISGLELCQVVRQDAQWEDLPLLVVTAHTDATSLQQAFAAGADDFIAKPVLGPELVTRVLSRIDRTRLRQQSGNTDHSP